MLTVLTIIVCEHYNIIQMPVYSYQLLLIIPNVDEDSKQTRQNNFTLKIRIIGIFYIQNRNELLNKIKDLIQMIKVTFYPEKLILFT